MYIVFDVFVDGRVQETIRPASQKLRDIHSFIGSESATLIRKYGAGVYLRRRTVYS